MAKVNKADNAQYAELDKYMEELAHPPKMYKRGQIIKGIVIKTNDSEMIVDVGGRAEGVVTGKELRLNNQKVTKEPGEEVLVYVIKPENDKGQIELSIRRTGSARRWYDLRESMRANTPIKVKVIEANTGGVLVEIAGGLRGFVPSSQLDNSRIYTSGVYTSKEEATKTLQGKLAQLVGEMLEVVVMEIDEQKNRVILSEKNVGSEEDIKLRKQTLDTIAVGSILEGDVTGIAPFGLFVVAGGLEGLVHLSEISWDKVNNPGNFYKVGDKVKVQVIGIQDAGKRIAYSVKRLLPDPWDEVVKKYKVGQIINGEVTKIVDYGAFVRIDEGLNGLIHISELSDKLVKDPSEVVKEGETREVMVISMSKEERHLGLSIRRLKSGPPKGEKEEGENVDVAPEMARLDELLAEDTDQAA
jgi:small subunit ribosomal protein S1